MLKELLNIYGNQSNLARELGVSSMAVSKWRSGQTFPSRKNLEKIAAVLEISIGEVYERWRTEDEE